jgi:hypothetical protein
MNTFNGIEYLADSNVSDRYKEAYGSRPRHLIGEFFSKDDCDNYLANLAQVCANNESAEKEAKRVHNEETAKLAASLGVSRSTITRWMETM